MSSTLRAWARPTLAACQHQVRSILDATQADATVHSGSTSPSTNFERNAAMDSKLIAWNGDVQPEAVEILTGDGGLVVVPTKVGYIIMTSDKEGLERKFERFARAASGPRAAHA